MKKKIWITIAVIVAIIVGIIVYFAITDLNQEEKLRNELTEINDLVNEENINMEEVNKRLDTIVTTGDYAVVEKAFKNYLSDNFDNIMKIVEILNDKKITQILTAENYKNDGPEFVETKAYISTSKQNLETYKQKYEEFFTEDKAMSYINDKNLDDYYVDLYKNEFVGDIENDFKEDETSKSIDEIIEILDISEDVINLLSENKDSWKIEGDTIVFSTDSLSQEYNNLLDNLK